jgi:hypothetical protein
LGRRRFDHLVREVSVAARTPIGRYALWLHLHEIGIDPERLDENGALAFCSGPARIFLAGLGLPLTPRAERRLRRAVDAFDPERLSPEDLESSWESEG